MSPHKFHSADLKHAKVNGQSIAYRSIGDGPPVLLLHGFPQTHMMWHRVAEVLAAQFTVVAADLRGYGDSSKPKGTKNYSFHNMAADQVALMNSLGFGCFHLVGHDRGARVAHRLALETPQAVKTITLMDIIPTHLLLSELSQSIARAYYHWFFLSQPTPMPETLIGADPDYYYENCLGGWGKADLKQFPAKALDAYRKAWRDPDTIRGMCEDYRATLEYDFNYDAADLKQRLSCPALVLYGANGAMAAEYDVPQTWETRMTTMFSAPIPGGHFFVDESPDETVDALKGFLMRYKD